MSNASQVRHDALVVPDDMSRADVQALAERTARTQIGEHDAVAFVHLHGSRPADGAAGQVEWRFSYQVTSGGRDIHTES